VIVRTQQLLARLRDLTGKSTDNQGLRRYSDFRNADEFVEWEKVKWQSVDGSIFNDSKYPGAFNATKNPIYHPEVKQWCDENCRRRYISYRKNIYFEDEKDATVFIMRWC
jgi:hypothetical protein